MLGRFAELERSPEHIHSYRISPLSLWNAAASGLEAATVIDFLLTFSKYPVPPHVVVDIETEIKRYGTISLVAYEEELALFSEDPYLLTELFHNPTIRIYLKERVTPQHLLLREGTRGAIKQALLREGFPIKDVAGYALGGALSIQLRSVTTKGQPLHLRGYQLGAIDSFYAQGSSLGGSGVIVLPCGAGKTLTGIGVMEKLQTETLILTTNITALRQWKAELLEKTTLEEDLIGEYSGEKKEIKPVTISTYQTLTYRRSKGEDFAHFGIFDQKNWGLIIYDEVHLLPAPVFQVTSEVQAKRRLGLTATLIREDGKEDDVFSLIGPKKYDVPWKELERQNYIATANCVELRIPLPEYLKMHYATATSRDKFRISAENPDKVTVVTELLKKHADSQVLIIGQYVHQLESIAEYLCVPVITGKTPNSTRARLYADFKSGAKRHLVVSKVANFAIDLPDANVAIQVSGTFGSRQEEAQRLGRVLRPKQKDNTAYFYSIVTENTKEQYFASNRQLFLTEQGYSYSIFPAYQYLDSPKEADSQRVFS